MERKRKIKPFRWKVADVLADYPSIRSTDIHPIQGEFKDLGDEEAAKLVKSISSYGFFVPIFLWRDPADNTAYSLDGHQRCRVINEAFPDGKYLPYVPIAASTQDEALKKLLLIDSKYGKVTKEGYDELVARIEGGEEFMEEFTTYKEYQDFTVPHSTDGEEEEKLPKGKQVQDAWALEVTCRDEDDQKATFEKLIKMGLIVKIITI